MSPRRSNQISNAFRKLKLRKQLAKTKLAEASDGPSPAKPRLRLVTDNDAPAPATKDKKPA